MLTVTLANIAGNPYCVGANKSFTVTLVVEGVDICRWEVYDAATDKWVIVNMYYRSDLHRIEIGVRVEVGEFERHLDVAWRKYVYADEIDCHSIGEIPSQFYNNYYCDWSSATAVIS